MPADLEALRGQLEKIAGAAHVDGRTPAAARFAVDGVAPGLLVRPGTQEEVSKVAAACAGAGAAMIPWGGGAAMGLGNAPSGADVIILFDRLDRIVELDAANLCVTVEAGVRLSFLQAALAEKKQFLPLDPPAASRVTVGGLLAANQSGPGRLLFGTARDWVLGMRVVLPDGERIRCGGRVIKNVSGYDMDKLFIGSLGTLGLLTEATFKLLPLPVARASLVALFPDLEQAAAVVRKALESFLLPEALELMDPAAAALLAGRLGLAPLPGAWGLSVALSGSQATVERQAADFAALMRDGGGRVTPQPDGQAAAAWDSIRNLFDLVPVPAEGRVLCRIAVPIARTAELLAAASALGRRLGLAAAAIAHAGSGVIRAVYPLGPKVPPLEALAEGLLGLRQQATAAEGSLVLWEAPPGLKARIDAWGKPGDGIEVMRRLKAKFDPRRLCNPGRFPGGI